MSKSYLDAGDVYSKSKRYIVNNWSDEDFTQHFGSETTYNDTKVIETQPAYDITIKAGEMRELGQFEAFTFTRHFVDREMFKYAATLETRTEVERAEMGVNNRELRKPYEDKTIQEIEAGKATPFMDKLREEIRQEELKKIQEETIKLEKKEVKVDSKSEFKGVK